MLEAFPWFILLSVVWAVASEHSHLVSSEGEAGHYQCRIQGVVRGKLEKEHIRGMDEALGKQPVDLLG